MQVEVVRHLVFSALEHLPLHLAIKGSVQMEDEDVEENRDQAESTQVRDGVLFVTDDKEARYKRDCLDKDPKDLVIEGSL